MIENPPLTWKDGARCAYGPKTAVPRILRLLDPYGLKVAFYVPGGIIEHYPAVIEEIVARGHELGHHGYLHEKPFLLKSAEEEEALLVRTLEIFKRQLGLTPLGSRTPSADHWLAISSES